MNTEGIDQFVNNLMNKIIPKNGWVNSDDVGKCFHNIRADITFYKKDKLVGFIHTKEAFCYYSFKAVVLYPFDTSMFKELSKAKKWVEDKIEIMFIN